MGERMEEADADIISRMPEAILSHILSRLPTDEAVRTSILSKKWKMRWTSIFNLHLCEKRTKDFADFVEKVLGLCQSKTIQNFSLRCCFQSDNCIAKWIRFAVEHNVRKLDLDIEFIGYGREVVSPMLPPCIFTCKTLVELRLHPKKFDICIPDSVVCFPNLKLLHISSDYLDGDLINKLPGGCPVLEEFSLLGSCPGWYSRDIAKVNISMPTLKKLTIILTKQIFEVRVVVRAPNLEYLRIYADPLKLFVLNEIPFISEVFVVLGPHHVSRDEANAMEFLRKINPAKFLLIPFRTMEDLNIAFNGDLPTFPNIIRLELDLIHGFGRKPLPHFLHKLPNLEVLILKKCAWNVTGKRASCGEEIEDFNGVPRCLLLHVKLIEMDYLIGYDEETKVVQCSYMEVIKYLLKNSKVLKKFLVKCNGYTRPEVRPEDIEREIHTFPKGSETCKIEVCQTFSYCPTGSYDEV